MTDPIFQDPVIGKLIKDIDLKPAELTIDHLCVMSYHIAKTMGSGSYHLSARLGMLNSMCMRQS
jgi:hypothetical protein